MCRAPSAVAEFDCRPYLSLFAMDIGGCAVAGTDLGALNGAITGQDAMRLMTYMGTRIGKPLPPLFRDRELEVRAFSDAYPPESRSAGLQVVQ
jgi:hypothetical protein